MDATPALLRGEIWQGEIEIFGFKGNKVEGGVENCGGS